MKKGALKSWFIGKVQRKVMGMYKALFGRVWVTVTPNLKLRGRDLERCWVKKQNLEQYRSNVGKKSLLVHMCIAAGLEGHVGGWQWVTAGWGVSAGRLNFQSDFIVLFVYILAIKDLFVCIYKKKLLIYQCIWLPTLWNNFSVTEYFSTFLFSLKHFDKLGKHVTFGQDTRPVKAYFLYKIPPRGCGEN